jgi:hypothetical protein
MRESRKTKKCRIADAATGGWATESRVIWGIQFAVRNALPLGISVRAARQCRSSAGDALVWNAEHDARGRKD